MSIFSNTLNLKNFVLNPHIHVVKVVGNSKDKFVGHIYLLLTLVSEGVAFKIGKSEDLYKSMANYHSRGSKYDFSRCIEFRASSKEALREILKEEEQRLLKKIRENKGFKTLQGKEHFLIERDSEESVLLANKELISEIEEIFKSWNVIPLNKIKVEGFKDIYFHEPIYSPQIKGGKDIFRAFEEGFHLVNLNSKTQSGKTGAIMSAMILIAMQAWSNNKKTPKMIVATPLNDKETKAQTTMRVPMVEDSRFEDQPLISQDKVMILSDLLKFIKKLDVIEGPIYIFLDEYQRATKNGQTVDKFFKQVLKLNTELFGETPEDFVEILKKKQIYFAFISATDFYMDWLTSEDAYSEFFKKLELEVGEGYVGWEDYYNAGLIEDVVKIYDEKFKNLTSRFKQKMNSFLKQSDPNKYILIRKEQKLNIQILKNSLLEEYGDKIQILEHHGENKIDSNLLKFKPPKPTFIILKDYWRAAKTLNATHIGMVFDRFLSNPHLQSVDTILQGLLGRLTGHKDLLQIKIFTNKQTLESFLSENGRAVLDLKTIQDGRDIHKFQETSRRNFIEKIPDDIKENLSDKLLVSWIKGMERYKGRKKPIVRLIPNQVKRLTANGKLNSLEDVDPDFFKSNSVISEPLSKVASGGMLPTSDTILWVNYNPKSPSVIKITEIFYQPKTDSVKIAIKQGVLGWK